MAASLLLLILAAQAGDQKGEPQPEVWRAMNVPSAAPRTPEQQLATFRVPSAFRVELVAAEPLVAAPVAAAWDPDGRLWVVEMRGYMATIDGDGEDQPVGRVVVLEDLDGDGRMDKSTVFLDKLVMPRAVGFAEGGVLVAEPPTLWYARDTDGDGVCDLKLSAGTYGRQGPVQGTDNGLMRALDNWIYNAHSQRRFKFKAGALVQEATIARGQWGIAQDDYGRLYTNNNSSFLHADLVPYDDLKRHPYFRIHPAGVNERIVADQSVRSIRVNPGINRGYRAEMLREDGSLAVTTAACGPTIYRADRFPPLYRGNAFVPEPAGNVVCRFVLEPDGIRIKTRHVVEEAEFLASTDERFRPVFCAVGPDGFLTVVDFYRGILEHKYSVTTFLRKQVLERGLEKPLDLGRIWRVVPRDAAGPAERPRLSQESSAQLVARLSHPNGWWRDTAQRLLVERADGDVVPALRALARSGAGAPGRIHALWTLEGIGAIDAESCRAAMAHDHPQVRIAALRAGKALLPTDAPLLAAASALVGDRDPAVRVQALTTLGDLSGLPEARGTLTAAITNDCADPLARQAVLSGLSGGEMRFLQDLLRLSAWKKTAPGRAELLRDLARLVVFSRDPDATARLLESIAEEPAAAAWRRDALIEGIRADASRGKRSRPIRLAQVPTAFRALAAGVESARPVLDRVTWPGDDRPVPPPPRPLTPPEQQRFEQGRGIYQLICIKCHMEDGRGTPGQGPPLVDSEWVHGSAERLLRITLQGLVGPISVDGQTWELEMPAMETALSDEQLAAVLTYVRRAWGNEADPVDAPAVGRMRHATRDRAKPWTAEELLKIP
jgi:mono/diheme cytochrome c family protein/glucose/arabinose dehydrogenase